MKSEPKNINHLWAALMLDKLNRVGVKTVCIAPGSRSTPLTWAAARHNSIQTVVHMDERGLGFHALGIARASNAPVAIITTSGSAVANLLPAVVEASQSRVPLILLTADRPFELIECGANQAIQQPGIFSHYTRWETSMPCPTTEIEPRVILSTMNYAVYQSMGDYPGPVHINCPFREPLSPESDGTDVEGYIKSLPVWNDHDYAWDRYPGYNKTQSNYTLEELRSKKRGLLIVGQLYNEEEVRKVCHLASDLGWPVIADVSSQLRLSNRLDYLVAYADQLLLTKDYDLLELVNCIVHVGGALVSKRIQALIDSHNGGTYMRIVNYPERFDPSHCVTQFVDFSESIALPKKSGSSVFDTAWRDALVTLSDTIGCFFAGQFSGMVLSEPEVVRSITQTETHAVFLGNSMPIRDADMYGAAEGYVTRVFANRGASGIDGNIATAAGIAHSVGSITCVLGDLAALHDLNSLGLLKANKVVLVIINNAGGGIFSFLPIAEYGEYAEEFFNTPHDCRFESAAGMYGLEYAQPETMMDFQTAYDAALASDSSTIIEVITDRNENVRVHRELELKLIEFMEEEAK